ncbi:MAG: phosphoribosylformylglycinamidine synthase [Eubacteriales bacterium]|nr:phosphoribosylformylglycinamidine synthase [Eubacteriales bacterium]
MAIKRLFVEKKKGFDIEAGALCRDLKENLGLGGLKSVRIINRYDVEGMSDADIELTRDTVFAEPQVDNISFGEISIDDKYFATEYLPGQFDQRADSAAQCVQIMTGGEKPIVRTAKIVVLCGDISDDDVNSAANYCINPVESRRASIEMPESLIDKSDEPLDVATIDGFCDADDDGLKAMIADMGLAMDFDDISFCRDYFKNTEKRNPTVTEIRMIDTYWSDHCRHTTFSTILDNVKIDDEIIAAAYEEYKKSRDFVYQNRTPKNICLMDIATIAVKELKKQGRLSALDESEEINACSINVKLDMADGTKEDWLIMFKNETHNHPTEIEPFGGAATCLGGAIRDPLSGRSYVYQAMRVTGSGNPCKGAAPTLHGKLPQRKITVGAAQGYSSYGNQIGLATGQVHEIYDEGYVAKRMEIGAVIAAAPKANVIREVPEPGDVVILLGGMTGRDGCGGATGSSKAHNDSSLETCGAEVQKGNAPVERKLQRLFRKPEVTHMIRRCNDFGAGGVSVAVGELADGLCINLDKVPKKYDGLDGTELAISESQERMAVVIRAKDTDKFIAEADKENLDAVCVAEVTDTNRLVMSWRGKVICDISRDFLNTNGAEKHNDVKVDKADFSADVFDFSATGDTYAEKFKNMMSDLNIASQHGLAERFDSTIGAGTVFMPFGGKYQLTPQQNMVAKVPTLHKDTDTATVMAFGYNPKLSAKNPYMGALYAVVDSVTRAVVAGADYKDIYLTFQEYFERLGVDPKRWGKPLSALLGAYTAQEKLGLAAIGGKDSMSGSFNDIDVPPTLVSFAVAPLSASHAVSSEFKGTDNLVFMLSPKYDENNMPDFESLKVLYDMLYMMMRDDKVKLINSAWAIGYGGAAEAICKMSLGNKIGFEFTDCCDKSELFKAKYGSVIIEVKGLGATGFMGNDINVTKLGHTMAEPCIKICGENIPLDDIEKAWTEPLEGVFATKAECENAGMKKFEYGERINIRPKTTFAKPRVFIPAFPGTNCEYDSAKAFERAGADADVRIFRNLKPSHIAESIDSFADAIDKAQIIMFPGGFSGGDEPDGSGKFIKAAFENEKVRTAVMELLNNRDGLILGICNGFQALIKLGLVPYGEIRKAESNSPTLTFNTIGRHMSRLAATRIASVKSPWLAGVEVGDIHQIAISHGEGRFVASPETIAEMEKNGQIATQYVDQNGEPTYDMPSNPNGSYYAIEGITSPDGRVFGKMGHSERFAANVFKNVPGNKDQKLFESGVKYFK